MIRSYLIDGKHLHGTLLLSPNGKHYSVGLYQFSLRQIMSYIELYKHNSNINSIYWIFMIKCIYVFYVICRKRRIKDVQLIYVWYDESDA